MNPEELEEITEAVINKIKDKYILVEKKFNLKDYETEEEKAKIVASNTFIDNITTISCGYFKIDRDELMYNSKRSRLKSQYSTVVWCIAYLCLELPEKKIQLRVLGEFFGKDHSTIINWNRLAENKMVKNFEYKYDIYEVKKLVEQSLKIN